MDEVFPNLYVGDIMAASNKDILMRCGITHIINLAASESFPDKYPSSFQYLKITVRDNRQVNISEKFEECVQFIKKAIFHHNGKVLVHCYAGQSRSATIAVAYLMSVHGKSYQQAVETVREARPVININSGFVKQLKQYEKSLNFGQKSNSV